MTEFIIFITSLVSDVDDRVRRQVTTTETIVMIIAPTPRLVNGQLEVAFIVINQQGTLLNGTEVYDTVVENEEELVKAVSKF